VRALPRAGAVIVATVAALVALGAGPALAHGDLRLVDEVLHLDPGASARFDGGVHYHRLVGRLEADGPVAVRLVDRTTSEVVVAPPASTMVTLNALRRCCEAQAWAPHTLVVENPGQRPITVDARVALVHDDLAVMVDGAEPGTRSGVAVFTVGWVLVLWRLTRRAPLASPPVRSFLLLTGFVGGGLGLAVYGAVRYGGWGAPGLLAALFDVPVLPVNSGVSRPSLLIWLTLLVWYVAAAQWFRGRTTVPQGTWATGGLLLGSVPVVTGVAVLAAYGRAGLPLAWTTAAVLPLAAVAVRHRPAQTGATPPVAAAPRECTPE
jgi:hypothetical protein